MGIDSEPNKWQATSEQFSQRWKLESQAVVVLDPNSYKHFQEMGLSMRIIFAGYGRIVATKIN